MFYSPYSKMRNVYRAQMNSFIRVFHASPNAPAVDVYANGNLIVSNLTYKELSKYMPAPPGNYNITVYPTGQRENPVINTNLYIPENVVFNVAVIGNFPNISLYPIPEPTAANNFDRTCVRFVHLSPNAPAVDIKLSDGTLVFGNVHYKDITNYLCTLSGIYTFTVSLAGTDNVVLTVPNVKLDPYNFYTIYAVGLAGETPALEALPVLEPR